MIYRFLEQFYIAIQSILPHYLSFVAAVLSAIVASLEVERRRRKQESKAKHIQSLKKVNAQNQFILAQLANNLQDIEAITQNMIQGISIVNTLGAGPVPVVFNRDHVDLIDDDEIRHLIDGLLISLVSHNRLMEMIRLFPSDWFGATKDKGSRQEPLNSVVAMLIVKFWDVITIYDHFITVMSLLEALIISLETKCETTVAHPEAEKIIKDRSRSYRKILIQSRGGIKKLIQERNLSPYIQEAKKIIINETE